MGDKTTYRSYFAIDDKYYASVTEQLINEGKVSWKSFYPHETFISLMEKVHTVLSGKDTRSLWVEGAYGTGKSHAALTIKSMLESSDDEIKAYFKDYGLSMDLCNQLITDKNNGKLLTVHRIGSSSIKSDEDLIVAIQESLSAALQAHGIEKAGEKSLRGAMLKWLEQKPQREFFSALMQEDKYVWSFGGKSIDDIVNDLTNGDPETVAELMHKLLQLAKENGIRALTLDVQDVEQYIRDVISENNLSAILFVWDEFTEYFLNNRNSLTGFQTLVEISASTPFYFMIVSHESSSLFADSATAKKILGRFVPLVKIELPDNMGFRLMAQAMKKNPDPTLSEVWQEYAADLNAELFEVRNTIIKQENHKGMGSKTYLQDSDLSNIVPIHPYAALVLKHISVVFVSNARSMFDFIISNDSNAKGFKYFIDHVSPTDNDNLLTVDMLWDFFYVQGQSGLTDEVRIILDSYNLIDNDSFTDDQKRVFKTILLLQAVSQRVSGIQILKPNNKNINLAYSGTDWPDSKASHIAEGLVKANLLFKRPVGDDTEYIVALGTNDTVEIGKLKDAMRNDKKTDKLVVDGNLLKAVSLPQAVASRLEIVAVSEKNFTQQVNIISQKELDNKFPVVVAFAVNESEQLKIRNLIAKHVQDTKNKNLLFIDTSSSILGNDTYESYIESMAYCRYYQKSDTKQANGFESQAKAVLNNWYSKIENGSFVLYNNEHLSGINCANREALIDEIRNFDRKVYPYGLEHFNLNDNMFTKGPLAAGAECGINQETKGTFRNSNKQYSIENMLTGVWKVDNYWQDIKKQSLPIVKAKLLVEDLISEAFEKSGRICILDIIDQLHQGKFGYMMCNITAVVLGFLMKEYANDKYYWSNETNSTPMSKATMKTMIATGMNEFIAPNKKYKREYLVAMSPEQGAFLRATAKIFNIAPEYCGSVEQARDHIRTIACRWPFPIWCIKFVVNDVAATPVNIIEEAIENYAGITNNGNMGGTSESDIANHLGKLFINNEALADDLANIFNEDSTQQGMLNYLKTYREGILPQLAKEINDNGKYITEVKNKFRSDAANWVWNIETANEKINVVILEYLIAKETATILKRSVSSYREVISVWNEKTNGFKIAYEVISNKCGDVKAILSMLYQLKDPNQSIQEFDKANFYELLKNSGELFNRYYDEQFETFKSEANMMLGTLNDDDKLAVFKSLRNGLFTVGYQEYFKYIDKTVKEYREGQSKVKLQQLWKDKTNTKSPKDWSDKYQMPIICMFAEDKQQEAERVFNTINELERHNVDNAKIEKAFAYLQQADFYDQLNDEAQRDECFMNRLLGDYKVLLKTPANIKEVLSTESNTSPYYWYTSPIVKKLIEREAEHVYKLEGSNLVMQVVDNMDLNALKQYVFDLINDNMRVGIEIMKHH